ncbi:MAG: ABC transporter substrate-binding protein [Dehalococcoidia bacterium]
MTRYRRGPLLVLPALAVAIALLLASCGGGGGNDNGGTDTPGTPGGTATITVWHSMPSIAESTLQAMVDEFNGSQTQYRVELVYQGGYTESLNKLISSIDSGNIPDIIQLSDVATQIMVDSEEVTPVQRFIDDEDYDLSDFEPKAIDYYTIDGDLYAMPFNLSGPVLYYDRQAFTDAGLDPDRPPRTLDEMRDAAQKLVDRPNAQPEGSGLAIEPSPWFFENMLAKSGALYVNNDNGRSGRADEALFAGPEGQEIIEWWAGMVHDGLAYDANDSTDAMLRLASGNASMAIASTAALRGAIAGITLLERDPSQYDVAPLPGPEGNGGIALGGAAFWVLERSSEQEQQGAWELLKFLSSPEQQARWHADTGYFPSRVSALDQPAAVKARQDFPQFNIALQQLHDSPETPATAGALVGPFNEVRDILKQALESVLAGAGDPAAALQQAADQASQIMQDYNRTAP